MSPSTVALLVALHLGSMHPIEKWLTLGLAFGPFVVLAVVIWVRRRQDARDTLADVGSGEDEGRRAGDLGTHPDGSC